MTLPNNIEAEQQLLGAIMNRNELLDRVSNKVTRDSFYDPVHADIFAAICENVERGLIASPVTLTAALRAHEGLSALGGAKYLATLSGASVASHAAMDYASIIQDAHKRRELITIADEMRHAAENDSKLSPAEQIERAESSLYTLAEEKAAGKGPVTFMASITKAIESAHATYQRGGGISGIPTGLVDLDHKMSGLNKSDLIILAGRPSMGKALSMDAPVKLLSGWKRNGDLQIGDELASVDGAPSVVTGVYPQGVLEMYTITFVDGRQVECCGEHLWTVQSSKFDGQRTVSTLKIAEMMGRKRYQGRLSIPLVSGDFGAGNVTADPWLLGVLIGDGCLTQAIRFSTPDSHILGRIRATLPDYSVSHCGRYDYRITTPRGQENPLLDSLRGLGLIGKKSCEKFIPAEYLDAPKAVRLELLRGLMDTDGWVEKTGAMCYATSSRQLADDIRTLVWSLGGVCSMACVETTHLDSYRLYIRLDDPANAVTLPKKKERAVRVKPVRNTIAKIEKAGREECQCISVSHPSRLYVTNDYIVTHNTALATNMAFNIAKAYRKDSGEGGVVAFFSLEMSHDQLTSRILADAASISSHSIRSGDLTEDQMRSFLDAGRSIAEIPIIIDDTPAITVAQLFQRARQIKRTHGLDVLIVDYLQLMRGPNSTRGNRVQEISEISMGLKAIAKELNVPVIALSQLSRQVEQREDKRPQLSDLRESGSIEQDADIVMFVYRQEYYLEREKPEMGSKNFGDWVEAFEAAQGTADVIIGKNRHGSVGTVKLSFEGEFTRFGNLAHTWQR